MRTKSVIGNRYGKLVVTEDHGSRYVNGSSFRFVVAQCDCGTHTEPVRLVSLQKGDKSSCGCATRQQKRISDNIVGLKFGDMTIVEELPSTREGKKWLNTVRWCRCSCACGGTKDVRYSDLKNGSTTSCGCKLRAVHDSVNLIGKVFGQLTIIEELSSTKIGKRTLRNVLCRCSCGAEKAMRYRNLLEKHTISCGCSRKKEQACS